MPSAIDPRWRDVDIWFADRLLPDDPAGAAALAANQAAGLPAHDVSPLQARMLALIARMLGARRVLEIGTLGGYSTIHLARALPDGGQVVTLEADPHHAGVAAANLDRAGLAARVDLRVGRAVDSLPDLARAVAAGTAAPFDLVFIDADKPSNPVYLDWALTLVRPGAVIIADNVVRDGRVTDPDGDASVQGVRAFTDKVAADPRLTATVLQTVGVKGHDGFMMILVGDAPAAP